MQLLNDQSPTVGDVQERSERHRRALILKVARRVFVAEGYAATSMSRIAREVGGSKGTLYAYFSSKEELFKGIMTDESVADALGPESIDVGRGAREVLSILAHRIIETVITRRSMELYRLVVGESGRFPELLIWYHANGPARTRTVVSDVFRELISRSMLRDADPFTAAGHFLSILRSSEFQRDLLLTKEISADRIDAHVRSSLDAFLTGYGSPCC